MPIANIEMSEEDKSLVDKIVILAASLGGPPLVNDILSGLSREFNMPVLVLQQMESDFSEPLTSAWGKTSALHLTRLLHDTEIRNGDAYVIPYGMCPVFDHTDKAVIGHSERCTDDFDVVGQWGNCFKNCSSRFSGQVILVMLANAALRIEDLKSDLVSLQNNGGTIIYCRESQEVTGSYVEFHSPVKGYLEMETDQIVNYLNKISDSLYKVPETIPDSQDGMI